MTDRKDQSSKWVEILRAVNSPLGFFVLAILIVQALLGIIIGISGIDQERRVQLIWGMLGVIAFLILLVAFLAYYRPDSLNPRGRQLSLLIGPPEKLPNLDITLVDWDLNNCFVQTPHINASVSLVPSRVGPSFRVQFPPSFLDRLGDQDWLELDLKDKIGNRWKVRRFFVFENLLPLTLVEAIEKIRSDYGSEIEE